MQLVVITYNEYYLYSLELSYKIKRDGIVFLGLSYKIKEYLYSVLLYDY